MERTNNKFIIEERKQFLEDIIGDRKQFLEDIREIIQSTVSVAHQSENAPEYLTKSETANLLKISLPTLLELTKKGVFTSYRIGGRVLYNSKEVHSTLENNLKVKYIHS